MIRDVLHHSRLERLRLERGIPRREPNGKG